jgi:hypothetical protein
VTDALERIVHVMLLLVCLVMFGGVIGLALLVVWSLVFP